jgi:hypothetical protein
MKDGAGNSLCVCLLELCEGNLEGGFLFGNPEEYVKESSGS